MIRAITFDLDGVYFTESSFKNFKTAIAAKSAHPQLIDHVLAKSDEMINLKKGILTENQYWDYVRQTLDLTLTNNEIFKLLRDSYQTDPQVGAVVKKVRELGYKTCICSNNFITRVRELSAKFNFLSDFDVKVFSHEVGAIKPDSKIYQSLISQTGCRANEIIYSDDKEANVSAAKLSGINAFIYEDFGHFIQKLQLLGVSI